MIRSLSSVQKQVLIAGAIICMAGPVKADVLQGLGSALTSTLTQSANQSVQNTQSGVQNGIQTTIQNNIAHPNEVNAAKSVAGNTTTALNAKTLCSEIPAEMQTKYTKVCASFDASNPCSALPIAGSLTKQQARLQSICNARQSLTSLQGQTAAKVTPSSGTVSTEINQQLQNQLNTLLTRH